MHDSLSSIHIRWADDDDGDVEEQLKIEMEVLRRMALNVVESRTLNLEVGNNLALLQSWP